MTPGAESEDSLDGLQKRAGEMVAAGRDQDAVGACDRLITRYGDEDDPHVARAVAHAMALKCWCLRRSGDPQRLLAAVGELEARYAGACDPWLRTRVADGLSYKTSWLVANGRVEEAMTVIGELVDQFEGEGDPAAQVRVGEMLLSTASELSWVEPLRRQVLIMISLMTQPGLRWFASVLPTPAALKRALRRIGALAPARGWVAQRDARRRQMERLLAVYDLLIAGSEGRPDSRPARTATGARVNRAVALVGLGRWRAARTEFDALFAAGPGELGKALASARAGRDGVYPSTDVAIAIVANVAPDADHGDRSVAREILKEQRTTAKSLINRVNARIALITGR